MTAWTDYPLPGIDEPKNLAPIRQVDVVGYDHNKYCEVVFGGRRYEIKRGYLYRESGRIGDVYCLRHEELAELFPK